MSAAALRRVANLPIFAKLLLAPAVSILLLSLIVPMSLYAIDSQSALLTRLTTVEAERHDAYRRPGARTAGGQQPAQPPDRTAQQQR